MNVLVNKAIKSFVCGVVLSTVLGGTVLTANALSSSKSNVMDISANGVSYKAYNVVTTGKNTYNQNYASAYTNIYATNASSLQAGTVKVKPRLYYSDGTIAKEDDWSYSPSNSSGLGSTSLLLNANSSLAYYAWGLVEVYNGQGYTQRITYKSPSIRDFT